MLIVVRHQGSIAEKSSAQELNQGVSRKRVDYRFRVPFFGSFLGKQKRTGN